MKKILTFTLLVISLTLIPSLSQMAQAAPICEHIGPETIIRWGEGELTVGQIGRLTILKETPLLTEASNEVPFKILKAGETYRIYAFKPGSLSVGGGLYVHRDNRIRYETPSKTKLDLLKCKKQALDLKHISISINDTHALATAKLGKEKRVSWNEYNLNWYTYHEGYNRYYMVSYLNNKVAGLFTMDSSYFFQNIHIGSSRSDVKNTLGTPIRSILKGNIHFELNNNNEVQTFFRNGQYITIFYDLQKQGKVTGIQVISKEMEERKAASYGQPTPKLQSAFEMQMFDLLNAARVANGRKPLMWDGRARLAAWKHSQDMAVNHYFEHNNKKGQTPFERMAAEGIRYRAAGENIAMGYSSSIFAHIAFMNSPGHRENMLNPFYTYVGVGIHFQTGTKSPYYTQDFFLP